jgi:4-hydroxybenzoate polyprenyltransferase
MEFLRKYLGWRHWAVFYYNAVLENLFVVFYIALAQERYAGAFVLDTLVLLVFSILATTYGYLINDFSDIELDRQHGKANTFENDSRAKAVTVLLAVIVLSVLSCYPLWQRPYFVPLALVWFLIATFYSLKPVRLKERGTVGIVFVVMAQRVLPVLIIFATFRFWHLGDVLLLTLYILFRGLSSDVNHQLQDYHRDRQTGTATFAVSKGYRTVRRLFYFSLSSERILLAVILVYMNLRLPLEFWWAKGWLYLLSAIYFAALTVFWLRSLRHPAERQANPFEPGRRDLVQFLHHAYPSVLLPVGLNVLLTFMYLPFFALLLIQIMAKRLYSTDIIKNNFLVRTIVKIWKP